MRSSILAAALALAALTGCLPADAPSVAIPASSAAPSGDGAILNRLRAEAGAGALRPHPRLMAAAQAYAAELSRRGSVSHRGADGSDLTRRARAAGCAGGAMAENLAWGQASTQSALSGWMTSPPHRANMLGRRYADYGLGMSGGMVVLMLADHC